MPPGLHAGPGIADVEHFYSQAETKGEPGQACFAIQLHLLPVTVIVTHTDCKYFCNGHLASKHYMPH